MVKGSTTTAQKLPQLQEIGINPYLVNLAIGELEVHFFDCDVLIISIPPRKKEDAVVDFTAQIKMIAEHANDAKVKQVMFISSTGIYQDGNFIVNENIAPQPESETGKSLLAAENIFREKKNFTTTIIRFGGLIGPNRNLARHFAGKTAIANGLAPINLIHLYDCIGITQSILAKKAFGGIYHGVNPEHPTRSAFYTQACLDSGFEKPTFINELLTWKQIESINVPRNLAYTWKVQFNVEDRE